MTLESVDDVFDGVVEFPRAESARQLESLIGLDDVITLVVAESKVMLNPDLLEDWSERAYGKSVALLDCFSQRQRLIIFQGDVGSGKSALAESFGNLVAHDENIPVRLYRLSLSTRGIGAVGQMTQLLASAFRQVIDNTGNESANNGGPSSAAILLIDEADALAQSREIGQMHHEDRAGVNALVRGIDDVVASGYPILIVMCTNRYGALDPAIIRRAARVFDFKRPDEEQRAMLFRKYLEDIGFTDDQCAKLAAATGSRESRPYGHSYSDLVQRILPAVLLDALPDRTVEFDRTLEICESLEPTRPFEAQGPSS